MPVCIKTYIARELLDGHSHDLLTTMRCRCSKLNRRARSTSAKKCVMRENEERWKHLRELAAKEQDPQKLIELTREINNLLLFKQNRLRDGADKKPAG